MRPTGEGLDPESYQPICNRNDGEKEGGGSDWFLLYAGMEAGTNLFEKS
jgi:hypothetical protein